MRMKIALCAALFIALLLILPGCTSNKYVPCCTRNMLYDPDGTEKDTGAVCIFPNGTMFGPCNIDPNYTGMAICGNGSLCSDLKKEDDCVKTATCEWNGSACNSSDIGNPSARWPMPVCADSVPQSCINDRCTAMVCGYSTARPLPPASAQDWNAEEQMNNIGDPLAVMPSQDLLPAWDSVYTPAIGLQGLSCEFNSMNQKLYNKVKASRGNLWVNSFRFGVGQSFADFEQSKYFFPSTDKVCAANPEAKVDRFTTYLNEPNTYCAKKTGQGTHYKCVAPLGKYQGGMIFSTLETCKLYCGNGTAPYSCVLQNGEIYACNQDGFAYAGANAETICKDKCSIIDDPNSCATDTGKFPFLQTDDSGQARFRMKYVSDYMVDAAEIIGANVGPYAACTNYAEPQGGKQTGVWLSKDDDNRWICNDFGSWGSNGEGPWFWTYNDSVANDWDSNWAGEERLGELRTYFDNHAYSALDFDYEYYSKMLLVQYAGDDQEKRLPFECETSQDCMSGSCDTTYYKRSLCKMQDDTALYCQSSSSIWPNNHQTYPFTERTTGMYFLNGENDENTGMPVVSNKISGVGWLLTPDQSMNGQGYIYHIYSKEEIPLFDTCGIKPRDQNTQKICVGLYGVEDSAGDCILRSTSLWPADGDVCDQGCIGGSLEPIDLYEYHFDVNWGSVPPFSPDQNWAPGEFGTLCKGTGGSGADNPPPYVKLADYGWCAGCTYSTLAVQKVEWGLPNPGGVGSPKNYSCYEYRGEFNYVPGKLPFGGTLGANTNLQPAAAGTIDYGGAVRKEGGASTEPVRRSSSPSAYQYDSDGNLEEEPGENLFWCNDAWNAKGWWGPNEIPTPSAPYLKEKLTSYLQSNVMPILDEIDEKTRIPNHRACNRTLNTLKAGGKWDDAFECAATKYLYASDLSWSLDDKYCKIACPEGYACTWKGAEIGLANYWVCPTDYRLFNVDDPSDPTSRDTCDANCFEAGKSSPYAPLSICNEMLGDGAVVHAVGNTSMLEAIASGDNYGKVARADIEEGLASYMGMAGNTEEFTMWNGNAGKNAILARTYFLKSRCDTKPLVGIEILPDETLATLVGPPSSCNLRYPIDPVTGNDCRGKLHKFFFKLSPEATFPVRVGRGTPDKYPGEVDILLQDWYPMCNYAGRLPGENESLEIENRLDFSRALLANFSTPSLIWSFGFPSGSKCNQTFFLDYLFNKTSEMVDVGITGIIYSGWSMQNGSGYGAEKRDYLDNAVYEGGYYLGGATIPHDFHDELNTGLTTAPALARGSGENLQLLYWPDWEDGYSEAFCALERFSKRTVGYTQMTYGQKVYAENKTCFCEQCTEYDRITGVCVNDQTSTEENLEQLYCNDGAKCAMPADEPNAFGKYKCSERCLNTTACILCNDLPEAVSFCRISFVDSPARGYAWPYPNITDDYWEFLTGLSSSEKCCLEADTAGAGAVKYTYTSLTGTRQQSEFLQFPARGESGMDCGRAPSTDVLSYCGIKVPISQKSIACMRIDADTGGGGTPAGVCGSSTQGSGICNGNLVSGECPSITNSGCCEEIDGCGWTGSECIVDDEGPYSVNCANFNNNQEGCEAFESFGGCSWEGTCGTVVANSGTCEGGSVSVVCGSISNPACCDGQPACNWDGAACVVDPSGGSPFMTCQAFNDNPVGCREFSPRCTWVPSSNGLPGNEGGGETDSGGGNGGGEGQEGGGATEGSDKGDKEKKDKEEGGAIE